MLKRVSLITAGLALSIGAFAMQADTATDVSPFQLNVINSTASDAKAEGSCGEGKCGASKKEEAEGSCGADKKDAEGSCGTDKKDAEGKCGEGKCGGSV